MTKRKPHTATVKRIRSRERLVDGKFYLVHGIERGEWLIMTWEVERDDGYFVAFGIIRNWSEVDVWELPETKKT